MNLGTLSISIVSQKDITPSRNYSELYFFALKGVELPSAPNAQLPSSTPLQLGLKYNSSARLNPTRASKSINCPQVC